MKKQSFNKRQNGIAFVVSVFLISFCILSPAFSQEGAGNSYKAFMQKNPFLTTELYINNMDLIKGKTVKVERTSYEMDEEGNKRFGDSNCPCVSITYYKFNDEGVLEGKYYLLKETSGTVLYKRKWVYSYGKNKYTSIITDYKRDEETKYVYKVSKKDGLLEVKCKDSKSQYEETILIGEDTKVVNEQRGEWNPTKREYTYTDDSCFTKFYVDDNLLRTSNYYRGKDTTSVQEQYQETGKLIMKIDFNSDFTEGLSKIETLMDGEVSEEKINGVVTRKYCSAGYADYESRKPYNQTVGPYSETVVEILDSADEVTQLGF